VAISIFTVSVLALLSILSQGISSTNSTKKKVIAAYLAEEGVELIRNKRDTLVISSSTAQVGWNSFSTTTSSTCNGTTGCYVDDSNTLVACGSTCPTLKYDSTNGKYNYTTGVDSGYTRKITTTLISADERKITSLVSWPQGLGSSSVTFSENLFNWIE
jgi:Tfp pilus assembly protein PilV